VVERHDFLASFPSRPPLRQRNPWARDSARDSTGWAWRWDTGFRAIGVEKIRRLGPYVGSVAQFTLVDLFAGCGGMTRGFQDSGRFRGILAVEADSDAAQTYRTNFGDHLAEALIEDVAGFPKADAVIGGPPCQGFSPLNRDVVGFERRGLWREYLRALEQAEPRAFVMENVPELLRAVEYAEFKRCAEDLGFNVEGRILNAADFGVPQRRRRAIVIGMRARDIPWPQATHAETPSADGPAKPWATFREAVAGLPMQPDERNWHRSRNPRPDSVRRYKAVPRDGGDRFAMQRNLDRAGLGHLVPRCWREKPTGTTDVFGRLWWDRPTLTIRTEFFKPEKGRYLHPSAHRPITLREAARCMSFPDDFIFPENQAMTSVARQIGNAVPPLLARHIAEALSATLGAQAKASRTQTAVAA
jgi:DNA (cytosine-5)-methyltransferase 1